MTDTSDKSDKPKPIHTLRIGSIQAAIWSNAGQHGAFYNVTIDRRYLDQDEKWQSSGSFGRDDLLVVAKIADAAHSFICERQAADRQQSETEGDGSNGVHTAAQAEAGRRRSR